MSRVQIYAPRRPMFCWHCDELRVGVLIREVSKTTNVPFICARCLALALKDATKQNWLSQFLLWEANSKLGKEIQREKDHATRQQNP